MRKSILTLTLFLFSIFAIEAQNETMYFMKSGEVIKQLNINTEVDSLIFYAPSTDPISVSSMDLIPDAITLFSGETSNLSDYLSISPANATDKSVTWSSDALSTVSVDNNTGVATAGSTAGLATITATTDDGSNISATITITVSEETPNPYYTEGAIANAVYIGRWTKKNIPVNFTDTFYDHSFHNGSMIKVNFTGTSAKINLGPSSSYAWKIDDGAWQTGSTSFSSSLVTLAQGLDSKEHTLTIMGFSTSGMVNGNAFLKAGALELDTNAETRSPNINNKHIEFIGDSISTLGYEDSTMGEHWNWLIGEGLGWEQSHIAYPGINIDQMTQYYVYEFASQNASYFNDPNPLWDFTRYTPDAVVVNLGQNGGANQSQYETMFNLVRNKYPEATIFGVGLFYFSSSRNPSAVACENAVNALRNAGDTNIYFLGEAENTASTHPTPTQSATISGLLLPRIKEVLGI